MHGSHALHSGTAARFWIALGLLFMGAAAHAAPVRYTIQRIGLIDSAHTRSDGYQYSLAERLNALGQVTGYSSRYSGTTYLGRDTWFYNGTSTVQIGLTGSGYQRSDGYQESAVTKLNDQGFVTGSSNRYTGTAALGADAWLYNGVSTVQLGYTGVGYERTDGYRFSFARSLNNQGQVLGTSSRYSGATSLGNDMWLYSGGTTIQLGLTGAGYERSDGFRSSFAWDAEKALNEQGQVQGYSKRYAGMTDLGQDAWLYSGGTTTQIGFIGSGYERSDGYRYSITREFNAQGAAAGQSKRYSGTTDLGEDTWLYNGNSTVQIGLTGAGYTNSSGYRFSDVSAINDQGQVAGSSRTYGSTGWVGRDAWLYNGSTTVKIGLSAAVYERCGGVSSSYIADNSSLYSSVNAAGQVMGYTSRCDMGYVSDPNGNWVLSAVSRGSDAWVYNGNQTVQVGLTGGLYEVADPDNATLIKKRSSEIYKLNDNGQAIGTSERYLSPYNSDVNDNDRDAWIFDGTSTVQIGFSGAGYEGSDGWRRSEVRFLNEQGQAAGWSARRSGTTLLGADAWLYDLETNQTFNLTLSVNPITNYALSEVKYLGEDGLVLGFSTLYDQITGASLGDHAFYFTIEEGLLDLGLLVDDFTEDGWLTLATAITANGIGNIIGNGANVNGSGGFVTPQAAYLLTSTSVVPIPAAVWLFASGLGLLGWMKRRQSA